MTHSYIKKKRLSWLLVEVFWACRLDFNVSMILILLVFSLTLVFFNEVDNQDMPCEAKSGPSKKDNSMFWWMHIVFEKKCIWENATHYNNNEYNSKKSWFTFRNFSWSFEIIIYPSSQSAFLLLLEMTFTSIYHRLWFWAMKKKGCIKLKRCLNDLDDLWSLQDQSCRMVVLLWEFVLTRHPFGFNFTLTFVFGMSF
jgi:hypothetical protein